MNVIGQCSCCGGDVIVPRVWMGVYPPIPKCRQCGATPKRNAVQMEKSSNNTWNKRGAK
jgi:hypothetical protein